MLSSVVFSQFLNGLQLTLIFPIFSWIFLCNSEKRHEGRCRWICANYPPWSCHPKCRSALRDCKVKVGKEDSRVGGSWIWDFLSWAGILLSLLGTSVPTFRPDPVSIYKERKYMYKLYKKNYTHQSIHKAVHIHTQIWRCIKLWLKLFSKDVLFNWHKVLNYAEQISTEILFWV